MAGLSTNATPPDNGATNKFEILGKPAAEDQQARLNFVSHEYFPVLQIPLMQGRLWDDAETQRGARVAVINETLAKKYFPAGDAVGHQIRMPEPEGRSADARKRFRRAMTGWRSSEWLAMRSTTD